MSKLLINENPLQVLPSLAVKTSLNEAIILQQIHYWIEKSDHFYDGRRWVYNSLDNWCLQFPFFSKSTIDRAMKSLCDRGLLIKGNYNKSKFDKTNWYSIDYDKLSQLEDDDEINVNSPISSNCSDGGHRDDVNNTIDYNTENTNIDYDTENNSPSELNSGVKETPARNEEKSRSKSGIKPSTDRQNKWIITKNQIISAMDKLDFGPDAPETEDALQVFRYYYRTYRSYTGHIHPNLNTKTMDNVVRNFVFGTDQIDSDISVDTYMDLIDEHFKTDYGKEIDWNIQHFMTDGVRNYLYLKITA